MKKIAVIGAGITGITTAYQLMKKGYDVTIFDKQKYAAMETSYANGGQLSACNGEVWTNWKTIYQGMQWIFKKDAPLSINLKPSLHKIGWFLSFLSNVKNHKKNTISTVKMAIESGNLLKELLKDENINFDFKEKGILHLCNSEDNFKHGLKINEWLTKAGLCLGEVVKFYDFGGGPIIGVKNGDEEKMLPFSKNFIINIDRDLRLITLSTSIKTLIN